jgi:hypothetical protein
MADRMSLHFWLHHEAMVAPKVVHCNNMVMEAVYAYWAKSRKEGNRKGHWVRRLGDIKSYTVSKAVDWIVNKEPQILIMIKK